MSVLFRVRSARNAVDFAIRQLLTFGFPVRETLPADHQFQEEMQRFFSLFDWPSHLKVHSSGNRLRILDVGARNFSLAPVFHRLFQEQGLRPEIHGIEIDAYRRLRNLRTRKDYANYFVSHVSDSQFHACDFLEWQLSADCIFALNPFVTEHPLLAWGLPLKHFRPEDFFKKIETLLPTRQGLLFVTNPSQEELEITKGYLTRGFDLLEEHNWFSTKGNHPRYGGLYRRN